MRVPEADRLEVGRRIVELEQGAVGHRIAANEDRVVPPAVVAKEGDFYRVGSVDDVMIREDLSGRVDDEAGSEDALDALAWIRRRHAEHAEHLFFIGAPCSDVGSRHD